MGSSGKGFGASRVIGCMTFGRLTKKIDGDIDA
jgi:hypothetical protein